MTFCLILHENTLKMPSKKSNFSFCSNLVAMMRILLLLSFLVLVSSLVSSPSFSARSSLSSACNNRCQWVQPFDCNESCRGGLSSRMCGEFYSPQRELSVSMTMMGTSSGDSASNQKVARIIFVSGAAPSGYGKTSPEPNPSWQTVAKQLCRRLPNFAGTNDKEDLISTRYVDAISVQPNDLADADIVVALGISSPEEERPFLKALDKISSIASSEGNQSLRAILADSSCSQNISQCRFAGSYQISSPLGDLIATIAPWSSVASGKRLLDKTDILLARKSSEDYIFAVLFAIHSLVTSIDVVKSDINPSWEKGPVRNIQEFAKMTDCCGPQISAALTDPQTKNAIDLLNAVDLRDQVGSYRVIVSNETPELEDFTLCILQQNNCFGCDAPILERPRVPIMKRWRGKTLDDTAARQILIGHLDDAEAHPECTQRKDWSWKIVVGANPAYDAFPMQHQIFYPSGGRSKSALWYDPVFCVETLDGDLVWCKRHYRCIPRKHWSDTSKDSTSTTPGAWTLSTLDNGMVSDEKWTTVDAADDLSWSVLHYSGAARRAGQSYVGALLCTPDGLWPESGRTGEGLERIRAAFQKCDLELWELFGGSTSDSFMWSDTFTDWKEKNPPPLSRIGDISITSWRNRERKEALEAKQRQ